MYEQVEKPKGNKSKAAANSVAQKKGSVKQGFGFVDNRPGIIEASEKMTTNPDNLNSTTHTQMNQPPADIKQLKRKVDGGTVVYTNNLRYAQKYNSKGILFVNNELNPTPPAPADLFMQDNDKTLNVTLNGTPHTFNGYKSKISLDTTTGEHQHKNDCLELANTLSSNKPRNKPQEVNYHYQPDTAYDELTARPKHKKANMSVGDSYHVVKRPIKEGDTRPNKKDEPVCAYHAATVVATDGGDRITCEANAGDDTQKVPAFYIYGSWNKIDTLTEHAQPGALDTINLNNASAKKKYKDDETFGTSDFREAYYEYYRNSKGDAPTLNKHKQ